MNTKKTILIMISGRGSNMEAIIKNCQNGILKESCEIIEVFSNKVSAPGLEIAKSYGYTTTAIDSKGKKKVTYNNLLLEYLKERQPDYIILAGYMKVIGNDITNAFPKQIINIHPADTSLHQGLHAYDWAWENKMESTKITVHYVDEGLDTGTVIAKCEVNLKNCKSLEEMEYAGLKVEHKFYSECLEKIFNN